MSEKKNHHYVPQFYLRNFSNDDKQIAIGLYLHEKNIFTTTAIDNIASKKYLYGRDNVVEDALAQLEGDIAKLFKIWIPGFYPPPPNSPAFAAVKHFILIQIFRTIKAGKDLSEGLNTGFQSILAIMNKDKNVVPDLTLVQDDPVLLSLIYTGDKLPLMDFLKAKTLVNLTDFPFISSDNPVIRYNQWMESKGLILGATGIAVKGLQIFFPIHPRIMICLYDPKIYKCGNKDEDFVKIELESDIHQLNGLQYLSSDKSLFFDNNISEKYLHHLATSYQYKRTENRHSSTVSENGVFPNGTPNYFILNSFVDPHIKLNLSFFRILKKAKNTKLPNNLPIPRDESFYEIQRREDRRFFS